MLSSLAKHEAHLPRVILGAHQLDQRHANRERIQSIIRCGTLRSSDHNARGRFFIS